MSDTRYVIVRVTDPEVEEVSVLAWRNREEAQDMHSEVRMDEWIPVSEDDTLQEDIEMALFALDMLRFGWDAAAQISLSEEVHQRIGVASGRLRARFHLDE